MATREQRSQRRTDGLTRERIVETAVALLDSAGARGLTFKALTERLATGPGAIYWHVPNKDALLAAATEAVVSTALAAGTTAAAPREQVREVALGLFDAIDEHPWLAAQLTAELSRNPRGAVTPRIYDSFGRRVRALGVPESGWFTATSALVHYVLGAAGQNASNAVAADHEVDRDEFLDSVSNAWEALDPDDFPFARAVADQLRGHDDRRQFLDGLDFVLTGIAAGR